MTFLLDEDSAEVEGMPCDDEYRARMALGSSALLCAMRVGRADIWPCGHNRTRANTQRVCMIERCRTCRRERWYRGFRIVAVRWQIRRAAEEIAQRRADDKRRHFQEATGRRIDEFRIPADQLIARTARAFGMEARDIVGRQRAARYIDARATVAKMLRDRGLSYPIVGRLLGGRDHSTIMNLCDKFEIYARRNPKVLQTYVALRDRAKVNQKISKNLATNLLTNPERPVDGLPPDETEAA